jgi:hypothetical protein
MQRGEGVELFVFGGQQYGDILVPSVGLRCGKKFCVWWAWVKLAGRRAFRMQAYF